MPTVPTPRQGLGKKLSKAPAPGLSSPPSGSSHAGSQDIAVQRKLLSRALRPWRAMTEATKLCFGHPFNPVARTTFGRSLTAACELFEHTTRRYDKPAWLLS